MNAPTAPRRRFLVRTLKGDRAGRYAVRLTANVRVTFGWDDDGAAAVDLEDYH